MKILITGANYMNKGAQSMLYVTADELSSRFDDVEIYFATSEVIEDKNLKLKIMFYSTDVQNIALGGVKGIKSGIKMLAKDVVKTVIGRKTNVWKSLDLKRTLPNLDMIVDVSGFNIGTKWPISQHEFYLNNIRLAKKYNIPIYLMPQSFGPFDYDRNREFIIDELKFLFTYPRLIFARENEGFQMLKSRFAFDNVILSTDLVLQNKGVDWSNLFYKKIELHLPELKTINQEKIAIIPNKQCFNFGNIEQIKSLYKKIISLLLFSKKTVYILKHSSQDLEICIAIKNLFSDNPDVVLIKEDLTCFEYDEFIKNFQFVVCSRFHGIVHAYRKGIPAIALGWAVKYQELAKNVGQQDYAFDILADDLSPEKILGKVEEMCRTYTENSSIIKEHVSEIQKHNCFDLLEDDFRSIE